MTLAVRYLREHGAGYTEHLFDYERHPTAVAAASATGVDPHLTLKTIVFVADDGTGVVVLMHGDGEVSAKKLARAMGAKTVRPATQREADRITGYRFGGTSPLGMRTPAQVYANRAIADMATVYVNGGSRGFLIGVDASTLLELTAARLAELTA